MTTTDYPLAKPAQMPAALATSIALSRNDDPSIHCDYDDQIAATIAITVAATLAYAGPRAWDRAELEDLPNGALIVDADGDRYVKSGGEWHFRRFTDGGGYGAPWEYMPLTLIHLPDEVEE